MRLSEYGKEPNAGGGGSCKGLTSAQTARSWLSFEEGLVRNENWVIVDIEEDPSANFKTLSPEFPPSTVCKVSYPLPMAPRQRGVPRRGGVWGIRRRQEAQARAIPPIAMLEPPSSPSEESDPLDSQVHTSRCTFRCRRNQSRISLLITVIATEEEEDSDSQEEVDREQEQIDQARVPAVDENIDNHTPDDVNLTEIVSGLGSPQHLDHVPQQPVRFSNQLTNRLEMNEEAYKPGTEQGEPSRA